MKKSSTTTKTIQLYWHQAWHYPVYAAGTLISIPIITLITNYLPPLVLANVLNRLAKGQFTPNDVWGSFGTSLLLYTCLMFAGVFTWRIVDTLSWRLEANVERDLAERVYGHLLGQSANFHADSFGGSLVSQSSKILGAYDQIADTTFYQVIPLFSGLIFTSIILSRRAPLYVVALVLFTAFYVTTAFWVTRKVRHLSSEHAAAESAQTGYLADSITNVMAIKSFAGKEYEERQYSKATTNTASHLMSLMHAMQRQMIYFSGLTSLIEVIALFIAIVSVVTFKANLATVFLVLTYTASISSQLFTFSNGSLRNYNRAFGNASGMTEILQLIPEIQDPVSPKEFKASLGTISFNDVTFIHDGANKEIFSKLNVQIKAGEKIGLVGHSGSGKTTFTRLLLRFSDVDSGEITIDGQNIASITQDDLHRSIAYVPQEPIMFHRSLFNNIRYGNFSASKETVFSAAKVAHADEFIKTLPQGYETLVGERGVKLSGGQRQRVAIARAMIKNAPILVLDEATSALDSESEVLIQDALWKLMEGRTAIVIAHRLSTIQKMDRIIVLDNGKISEQGTHKELIKNNGVYAGLWAHQSGGFLED
ncbi:MAG: ABC transporter ATP-binding protein [Candidatus Saccharibacteria bacterium]